MLPDSHLVYALNNEHRSDRPGRESTLAQTNAIADAKLVTRHEETHDDSHRSGEMPVKCFR
jgi:hypothetical protein